MNDESKTKVRKVRRVVRRITGATLLAAPFVSIAAFIFYRGGIVPVVIIFGLTALIAGAIIIGSELLWS